MAKRNEEDILQKTVGDLMGKEMNHTEIKNCPFCGGNASLSVRGNNVSGSVEFAKCECDDCHAVICVGKTEIVELIKEICIAKWNMRVSDNEEMADN